GSSACATGCSRRTISLALLLLPIVVAGVGLAVVFRSRLVGRVAGGRYDRYARGGAFIGSGPAIRPDGRVILYSSPRTGKGDLYLIDIDGRNRRRLTANPSYEGDGIFSPDGLRIAFIREEGSASHVWLMNADGTGERTVTSGTGYDTCPSFSPDGTRIMFLR